MLNKLFPWQYLLKLAAKRFDVIDPISVAARIRSFAQPSEVQEPIELLRAGIIFHARGLLNTKAIQHNLDWVWPYWVERQFNPRDRSFIPRAFSFSHINLTHRNWTALGLPDIPLYPIVDPRGLLTPLHDGWSIDCWFYDDEGGVLCPSRLPNAKQQLTDDTARRVSTELETETVQLVTEAVMEIDSNRPTVKYRVKIDSCINGWLIFALRPYNPEGVQFIEEAALLEDGSGWLVNDETSVKFHQQPDTVLFSNYRSGDVFFQLPGQQKQQKRSGASCPIGMVTSAALHRIDPGSLLSEYTISVPLELPADTPQHSLSTSWPEAESACARLQVPDKDIQFLYDSAVRTMIHLSAGEVIPGPYTYSRFWFRDACLMLNGLLAIGLHERCRRQLDKFPERQNMDGYFHSQDGEWDSNGQVLWIFDRYRRLTGGRFNPKWLGPIIKGAKWIDRKRITTADNPKLKGLLPAGFSAEHFGPNDNYYWDDFWSIAGLYAAAECLSVNGNKKEAQSILQLARDMEKDVLHSISLVNRDKGGPAVPTSPNRRLDSGAIGSIVADFPLQLLPPGDKRMIATAGYLWNNCLHKGCFFQDMIHSGINIYMTLELAQVYLRAENLRFIQLFQAAADFASPTGQWPEAIHPHTGGGCMGDGQHGWAAADWLLMVRNMFIMEEEQSLVIGRGILPEWLAAKKLLYFGPTLTTYGPVSVEISPGKDAIAIKLITEWYDTPPETIHVRIPGCTGTVLEAPEYSCTIKRET